MRDERAGGPVPSEHHAESFAVVVAEAPGSDEVERGAPLVGKSGNRLFQSFAAHGVYREQVSLVNVIACQPPGNKLDRILRKVTAINKIRRKQKVPLQLTPMECCKPRFDKEIENYDKLILTGKVAIQAVLNAETPINDIRGGPIEIVDENGRRRRILPTAHASYVLRRPSEGYAFDADIGRAVRWLKHNRLTWKEVKWINRPTVAQLRDYFNKLIGKAPAWDIETKPPIGGRPEQTRDPLLARLGLLGVFEEEVGGVVIPFLGNDGFSTFYTIGEMADIRSLCQKFFLHPRIVKTGWNSGWYDRLNIKKELGVDPNPIIDYILVHRAVQSEVSHKLGYATSIYTDAPPWKAARAALKAETDLEWRGYNIVDCAATARTGSIIWPLATLPKDQGGRDQKKALALHHKVQKFCGGLHEIGMLVDQAKRLEYDQKFRADAIEQLKRARSQSGIPDLNPNSVPQVRSILFDKWDLPAINFTKGGDPSTDDDSIRALSSKGFLKPNQREFLDALRRFRRASKYRGTYVRKLISYDKEITFDDLSDDDDDLFDEVGDAGEVDLLDEDERAKIKKKRSGSKKWGVLYPDGRIHADWNAHGPATQRLSSSNPNMTNFPRKLRDMLIPSPGNVFVYADMDQLELRVATAIWLIQNYLNVFKSNGDPHDVSATLIFGDLYAYCADKFEKSLLRDFAKRFTYAVIYGAEIETIHDVICSAEDKDGNLPFSHLMDRIEYTENAYASWTGNNPEVMIGWETELATFERQGYLAEPVVGFRRDFQNAGGEKNIRNEILNFRCQSSGAAIVHEAACELVEAIPFGKWGFGTGLVNHCHDALTTECPREKAEDVQKLQGEVMCRTVPGLSVPFTAKAKIVERWC